MSNPLIDNSSEMPFELPDDEREEFTSKHKELSILLDYPPYSINRSKYEELAKAIIEEGRRVMAEKSGARAFSTLEVKFQDDLEEARLYKKRYNDKKEAQKKAMELEGLSEDDPNVEKFY